MWAWGCGKGRPRAARARSGPGKACCGRFGHGRRPPRSRGTTEATSSAVLEPAYDIGGDTFDHSLDGNGL
ncbi:hypothetical protein, partial [Streptomyces sp. NPDC013489]|uniref:hypothetical protein n=1 Tax=Streptomyces sp. NPDC013489 TaxID=3155606 RepID=UPI0033DB9623